ncbi:MAG: hypothetical protein RPU42_00655, partial [Candidatus Sedimenticola sp. (ex Thyasira tokunagai)]
MKTIDINLIFHLLGEPCYGVNCTLAVAHDGVTTPWNRQTIPRRCALPCTTANAHFTPSNC